SYRCPAPAPDVPSSTPTSVHPDNGLDLNVVCQDSPRVRVAATACARGPGRCDRALVNVERDVGVGSLVGPVGDLHDGLARECGVECGADPCNGVVVEMGGGFVE